MYRDFVTHISFGKACLILWTIVGIWVKTSTTINPTANEIRVFTCAGCPERNGADGPYRWNYQFTYSQDNQVRRTAMRNMGRWMLQFTLFTSCTTCMTCMFDIAINMLNMMQVQASNETKNGDNKIDFTVIKKLFKRISLNCRKLTLMFLSVIAKLSND